jgi:septum formation protein
LVLLLARRKALSVARSHPKARVLGADTIVVCRGEILVKPRDLADAQRILRLLNGRTHYVYTGVALALEGGKRVYAQAAVSAVTARKLPEPLLLRLAGKHMDKAGGYAVQDRRDPFIARVRGERDNVIGLPLQAVRLVLRKAR